MKEDHLGKMILARTKEYSENVAMGYKATGVWKTISYKELGDKIDSAARALLEEGVGPGEMVGIFSTNRPEWAITDFAVQCINGVSVPIYATNTQKQTEYIVNDAKIEIMFVGNQEQYDLLKELSDDSLYLEKIITFDDGVRIKGKGSSHYSDFIKRGKRSRRGNDIKKRLKKASTEDLATIVYTSGTTGEPKGVMLTHSNFFHQFRAADVSFPVSHEDRSLCFLPLSHVFERAWSYYIFYHGAENYYMEDPKTVVDVLKEVQPTVMSSVPRLYEKIFATVHEKLPQASVFKRSMFKWAMKTGKEYAHKNKSGQVGAILKIRHKLADKMVLRKIRAVVGGDKNFFTVGGAALSKDIEEFFFSAGILICQGYGLTETSPLLTANSPKAFKFGTVGRPVLECRVKIDEDTGEILVKGPNIMKGYYNKPEETAETFKDGWFKTGDIGVIDQDGYLKITDRIKSLIITSGGKNISPQLVESTIGMDYYIEQIVAIGDGKKFISALIVPSFTALMEYAKDKGIGYSSKRDLIKNKKIIELFNERVKTQNRELGHVEQVKKFTLLPTEMSQERGELTPTLKFKRSFINEKYKKEIDKMYSG